MAQIATEFKRNKNWLSYKGITFRLDNDELNGFCVSSGNITILVMILWQNQEAFPYFFF